MAQGIGGSADAITRRHKMTLDEACNILNVKNARLAEDEELQTMLKVGSRSSMFGYS
jgi:import inner membrane translocase subunit TIM16